MNVGVVVIGRNEGERLRRCLASVTKSVRSIVYVDSGSTDGSPALARTMGVTVLDLDMSIPFTAARARNAGFKRLRQMLSEPAYVQFVDGDCELAAGWIENAAHWLAGHPEVAIVCGRLRERHPERSIYNFLCDVEWDTPVGEARACGGIALARVDVLDGVGGYRSDLIAGEEPELCVRIRAKGWKIWRLADEMAVHDAAMTRFGQWWKRCVRAGYAFAEGAFLHGRTPERFCVRESRRALVWGIAIPAAVLVTTMQFGAWGLVLLGIYPLQVLRLSSRGKRRLADNLLWAAFNVLGKFPEFVGQMNFLRNRFARSSARLIEYK